jgi:hypothetical protein
VTCWSGPVPGPDQSKVTCWNGPPKGPAASKVTYWSGPVPGPALSLRRVGRTGSFYYSQAPVVTGVFDGIPSVSASDTSASVSA